MCVNFTAFCLLSLKITLKNPLWKRQLCPKLINLIMENDWSHKSGANSNFYKVSIEVFLLSSHIFIKTSPVCFSVNKCLSAILIYLSISTNEPSLKSEIYGVMWQVEHEFKIQLVCLKLSPKYLLGISTLEDINTIDAYIFNEYLWYVLFSVILSIFFNLYVQVLGFYLLQWTVLSKLFCFWTICNKMILRSTYEACI